jgi:hypothetical protein
LNVSRFDVACTRRWGKHSPRRGSNELQSESALRHTLRTHNNFHYSHLHQHHPIEYYSSYRSAVHIQVQHRLIDRQVAPTSSPMSTYTQSPNSQQSAPRNSIRCSRCKTYRQQASPILPPPHPSLAHALQYHNACESCVNTRHINEPDNPVKILNEPMYIPLPPSKTTVPPGTYICSCVKPRGRTPPKEDQQGPPETLQPDPGVRYPVRPRELKGVVGIHERNRHMAVHRAERPLKCPVKGCRYHGQGFCRKGALISHLKVVHGGAVKNGCVPLAQPPAGSFKTNTWTGSWSFAREVSEMAGRWLWERTYR